MMERLPHGHIRLRVALAEDEGEYIRHVRQETLRAIGLTVRPETTSPLPHAVYLIADDVRRGRPVGMAESYFVEQQYASYEHTPYGSVGNLPEICPFSRLAGIRTVYADPGFRFHHALYLKLILGSAHIFRLLGARYAAATTNAADERLARLYDKTGGMRAGTFAHASFHPSLLALYLFELDRLLQHPGAPRMLRDLDLNLDLLRTVRSRSLPSVLPS
jgi:hypothetical protein